MTEPHDHEVPDSSAETASRLWERMVPMFSLLEGRLDHTLTRRHDIGLGQFMALGVLAREHPESVSVSGVARRLGVSVSAASRVLAQLERAGRTVRVAWPCDRRASRVTVTETGLDLWNRACHTLHHELSLAFGTLRFDERYAHLVARLCRTERERPAE
ncbi:MULTISPECIES: MarR family transcriptional regulator [Streptomyces]|uniref:MarR family winged helix-turn-helix transcriptional regulator n=1 Tax=Streptomyces TaxID=1883 RepID=UPI0014090D9D|nr:MULTISPECIES: MarR family transcriptional regulator [Streptomyces]MDH6228328.1 DNA-binding MarR family transcriptional regulator [Streptomyces sp. MJP52]